ncbi:unnamed protein product [Triticum turgidum subsp. durum]|uniref:Very-long-chain 3-oxoacyl-CoA reductase n=1 Tax=Triticum turgidum subsp. durum TaxID=4567 RepID=A0A9R0Z486_TRITD|nr:unnamed protein product [Triticum turgidum subsp. durum]
MLQDISETVSRTHGVLAKTVQFDFSLVSTPRGDEAMRRLREAVAGLDVGLLVNNAGVAKPGVVYLHEVDAEAWVSMIRVNLWALTEVTAAVLPGMVDRGRGAVVNIGSGCTVALPSVPFYSIYAATKRYVAQFSRSLYVEYRGKGIDVQCQDQLNQLMFVGSMTNANVYYGKFFKSHKKISSKQTRQILTKRNAIQQKLPCSLKGIAILRTTQIAIKNVQYSVLPQRRFTEKHNCFWYLDVDIFLYKLVEF